MLRTANNTDPAFNGSPTTYPQDNGASVICLKLMTVPTLVPATERADDESYRQDWLHSFHRVSVLTHAHGLLSSHAQRMPAHEMSMDTNDEGINNMRRTHTILARWLQPPHRPKQPRSRGHATPKHRRSRMIL